MENRERLLLVSFGDSRQYRFRYTEDPEETTLSHRNHLESIERRLDDYLTAEFPGKTFAYYITPKVTEVSINDAAEYNDYPVLDDAAITEIEKILKTEILNRGDQQELDLNAPYADVNAQAL